MLTSSMKSDVDQFSGTNIKKKERERDRDAFFIIEDWNAKVGSQEMPGITEKFHLRVQNEAGQRLTELYQENSLVTANTLIQQHKSWLYTWTSSDGQYRSQIDYIFFFFFLLLKMEKLYTVSQTRPGADCGSDHQLLMAKFRHKLKSGENH